MSGDYEPALDALAVWAVRYALGRMTYAVGIVTETLAANVGALSDVTRLRICDDIDEALAADRVGMEMDRRQWVMLRAALAASREGQ